LTMAINFAGVDHILAGSDYPHQIGSLDQMKQSIESLRISESDKEKIRSGNASRILGL
jgi:aminocarboxymuconate-semialdehyde decarboxylase